MANIELGAAEDEIRYWRAKEAMRQAELRLSAQAASKQAFEMRATALLGWIVAVCSLIGAGFVASGMTSKSGAFIAFIVPLLAAGAACASIVWPEEWKISGYDPDAVLDDDYDTELEVIESMASGYAEGIASNSLYLRSAGHRMRLAFFLSLLGPLAGGITLLC